MSDLIGQIKNRVQDLDDFALGNTLDGATPIWDSTAGRLLTTTPTRLGMITGRYYPLGESNRFTASLTYGNNEPVAVPFVLDTPTTFDRASITVNTAAEAGSTVRLAIYADNNHQPGDLVHDLGTVLATTTGAKTVTGSWAVPRGRWWAALCLQNTSTSTPASLPALLVFQKCLTDFGAGNELDNVSINCVNSGTNFFTGAWPTTWPTPTPAYRLMPRIVARKA